MRRFIWILLGLSLLAFGCRRREAPGPSADDRVCALGEDGPVFDVRGKDDGLYGVRGDAIGQAPLAHFDRAVETGAGAAVADGKRWIGIRLANDEAPALRAFTSQPANARIAVVVGGEVASVHKVREAITTSDLQISCCNPHACDRLDSILASRRK